MGHFINGNRVHLREVRESDINENYYKWMNDRDIVQYMEVRFMPQSYISLMEYFRQHSCKTDEPWFAICLHEGEQHIGNIKLGPINFYHRYADISCFIGEKDCWGHGYATEAIGLVVRFAFDCIDLYKVEAGVYAGNQASRRALEKNGFIEEGRSKKRLNFYGERQDDCRYGLTVDDYRKQHVS